VVLESACDDVASVTKHYPQCLAPQLVTHATIQVLEESTLRRPAGSVAKQFALALPDQLGTALEVSLVAWSLTNDRDG
jgi:hypothetical protein